MKQTNDSSVMYGLSKILDIELDDFISMEAEAIWFSENGILITALLTKVKELAINSERMRQRIDALEREQAPRAIPPFNNKRPAD